MQDLPLKWLAGETCELKINFIGKKGRVKNFYEIYNDDYASYIHPRKLLITCSNGKITKFNYWTPNWDKFKPGDSVVFFAEYYRSGKALQLKKVVKVPQLISIIWDTAQSATVKPMEPLLKLKGYVFNLNNKPDTVYFINPLKVFENLLSLESNLRLTYDKARLNYFYAAGKYEKKLILNYKEKQRGTVLRTDSFEIDYNYTLILNFDGRNGRFGDRGGSGENGGRCENGGDGGNGGRGEDGENGRDVKVTVELFDSAAGVSKIKAHFKSGEATIHFINLNESGRIKVNANGGTGGTGGDGGSGGLGGDAVNNTEQSCSEGARGRGGAGGDGGDGGNGGEVAVFLDNFNKKLTVKIICRNSGGLGGIGGTGGDGIFRQGNSGQSGKQGKSGGMIMFYPFSEFVGW